MKKLIAVTGKANRGKTDSVGLAGRLILSKHCGISLTSMREFACYSNPPVVEPVPGRVGARWADVACIVTIGRIKIGIESQGDPTRNCPRLLKTSLPMFAEQQCRLIICAARDGDI